MSSVLGCFRGRLRPLVVAASLAVAGLGGMAAPATAAFSPANPYASGTSNADIYIRKLTVFGDSFSRKNRKPFHNWAEQLRYDDLEVKALADFAISGATAGTYPGSTNDLANQITRWLNSSPTFVKKDLTVVYLGYNDIDGELDATGADLVHNTQNTGAIDYYRAGLDRIIAKGAIGSGNNRRLLLIEPHNWGRSPLYVGTDAAAIMANRTRIWDRLVAETAAPNPKIVAVDLFTPFECVFSYPDKFGFTSVTKKLPSGGDPEKYLYDSGTSGNFHFGHHGQVLIKQVIQYYLTRGWNAANTQKTPVDPTSDNPTGAQPQLLADLKAGQVFPGIACLPWPPPTTTTVATAKPGTATRPAPNLKELEAEPAHFGLAWARHVLGQK